MPEIMVSLGDHRGPFYEDSIVTISWHTQGAPEGATVSLWAEKTVTGHLIGPLASDLPIAGHYRWVVGFKTPPHRPCAVDKTGGCVGSMNSGTTYAIVARLYARARDSGPDVYYPTPLLATASTAAYPLRPAGATH